MRRPFACVPILVLLVLLLTAPAAAQEATPAASPGAAGGALDLAAMVLGADDLPPGYVPSYEEHYFTPAGVERETGIAAEEIEATGERAFYRSIYFGDDGTFLRLYVAEYASAEAVEAGFALTEDETRPLPEGVTFTAVDLPGPGVGEEPSETTVGAGQDEFGRFRDVDATFRVGRLLAGVAVEEFVPFEEGPGAADGTPAAEDAEATPAAWNGTPTAQDEERIALTAEVAAAFHDRIAAVLAGTEPAGVDLALPGLVLPTGETWPHPGLVPEGYREAAEVLVGDPAMAGEPAAGEGALADFADAFEGGYARTVAAGSEAGNPEVVPPFVTIGVSAFATAEDALAVLEAARGTPADLPVPGPTGRGEDRELADDPGLGGVDAELAHASAFNEEGRVDSAGVAFVVGAFLATVDVQAAADADAAMAAAVDLAQQQADCLADGGPCDEVAVPAGLEAPAGADEDGTPAP